MTKIPGDSGEWSAGSIGSTAGSVQSSMKARMRSMMIMKRWEGQTQNARKSLYRVRYKTVVPSSEWFMFIKGRLRQLYPRGWRLSQYHRLSDLSSHQNQPAPNRMAIFSWSKEAHSEPESEALHVATCPSSVQQLRVSAQRRPVTVLSMKTRDIWRGLSIDRPVYLSLNPCTAHFPHFQDKEF